MIGVVLAGATGGAGAVPPPPPPPSDASPWGTAYVSTHTASPGGTTVQGAANAAAALTGATVSPFQARKIQLAAGTYEEKVIPGAAYLSIIGATSVAADTVIHYTNPQSSGLIRQYPMETTRSLHLKNLTLEGEYSSYGLHCDGVSTPGVPYQLICENVHFKNRFAYYPIGLGAAGKVEMYFYDCTFEVNNSVAGAAPPGMAAFFGHNSPSQSAPSLVVIKNPTWLATGRDLVQWSDQNSGQADRFIVGPAASTAGSTVRVTDSTTTGTTTILYQVSSTYAVAGTASESVSTTLPSPLPKWDDDLSPHNVYFGI